MISRKTKLLKVCLLISALAAAVTAQTSSPRDSSASPSVAQINASSDSPVQAGAQTLIDALSAPINCPDGETLCVSEIVLARLKAATAGLKSLIVMDKENQAISTLKDQHIAFQDQIIAKYGNLDLNNQRLDTNSQRIDALGQQNVQILQAQHAEDKITIASLQKDLDHCRSGEKWIAAGSGLAGGLLGYKLHGVTLQNPFTTTANANVQRQFFDLNFAQTQAEQRMRNALKKLNR